jgi:D-3-phosphoglycerate dehydrogenase
VIASPHTAGITVEAARDIAVATATQWQAIFDGRMPPRLLNPDVWPRYCERFRDVFGFCPTAEDDSATTVLQNKEQLNR